MSTRKQSPLPTLSPEHVGLLFTTVNAGGSTPAAERALRQPDFFAPKAIILADGRGIDQGRVQYHPIPRHISLMTKTRHYVPAISRSLVRVLYYEGKRRRMPMTRLVDELLTQALVNTPGWETAAGIERQAQTNQDRHTR